MSETKNKNTMEKNSKIHNTKIQVNLTWYWDFEIFDPVLFEVFYSGPHKSRARYSI